MACLALGVGLSEEWLVIHHAQCQAWLQGNYLTSSAAVVHYNYAHLYNEQFVHGRLDRALIFLGLAVF